MKSCYRLLNSIPLLARRRRPLTTIFQPPTTTLHRTHNLPLSPPHQKRNVILFASTDDDNDDTTAPTAAPAEYNIKGLKTETARLASRAHKKITKISLRYEKAQSEVSSLLENPDPPLDALDNCPDVSAIEKDLEHWRTRLSKLTTLENELSSLKQSGGKTPAAALPPIVAELVSELDVRDAPPRRPQPNKRKKKVKQVEAPRKPYRRYESDGSVEIRVGKQAEDNDELSLDPRYRDGSDWWMHASGCPGSHVVIRSDNPSEEVIKDAAALAARQSKCSGGVIKVSLTQCRNVSKPPGAKAGLVMINGNVRTVSVKMKEAEKRLERLDKTVLIN
eukprot:CAMPEP_0172485450 /NCGR_PEP_ID=MMETSP1066-20121228/13496_1 /TAXON_ID=671091 /ORGANISM="Coscinodiscus wailesii, Strain CCMP2513" /LENGTH=333 /DNA_ID=CAMNT_0013250731 /DNA_START=165 /DNA_END=1166 /DNA_ORIENTATION=+